ncbi:hypothetical protein [Methanolobus halotolerans]|nr:hypothetical protein [Methanolobus halotolerans]
MADKITEKKDRKVDGEKEAKEAKVSPVRPGDSRVRGRRHLLDTCE